MTTDRQTEQVSESPLLPLLRMMLPGLSDDDSADLARHAYSQLEERVGKKLAAGLSDHQLAEFDRLMDADDDWACVQWLDTNVPQYPRITAIERAALLADIVVAVSRDVTAARGRRQYEELVRPTLSDLRAIIASGSDEVEEDVDESSVRVRLFDSGPVLHWTVSETGPRRFLVRSVSPRTFRIDDQPELEVLLADWNAECPPAHLRLDQAEGEVYVAAEGSIPVSFPIARGQLSEWIDLACSAIGEALSLVATIGDKAASRAIGRPRL